MGVPASATSIASITIYDLKNRRRFVRFLIRESITLIKESTMSQLRTETSEPILRRLGDMQLPSPDRKLAIQFNIILSPKTPSTSCGVLPLAFASGSYQRVATLR